MRYLGGKSKLAKYIAPIVAKSVGPNGTWWDPFTGGLSMAVALSKATGRPGIASDACAPLMTTYEAAANGWEPPRNVTAEDYDNARELPDDDPRKAFVGFGCSYSGKWFGGYAHSRSRNYAAESARAVLRDVQLLRDSGVSFACLDFLEVEPSDATNLTIYADPPYRNTTGYDALEGFDHDRFYTRCEEWASNGASVFVSEYEAINRPGWGQVWERSYKAGISGGSNGEATKRSDRLYQVICRAREQNRT